MTRDEFRDWFRFFRARFPSITSWLGKFPLAHDSASESQRLQPTQKEILTGWHETLGKTELKDALEATRKLASGEEEMPPSFDRIPASVRMAALKMRRAQVFAAPKKTDTRETTYRCKLCQDSGFVPVIYPDDVAEIERVWPEGPPDRFNYGDVYFHAGAVLRSAWSSLDCSCEMGAVRQSKVRYDAQRHCRFDEINQDRYEQVRAWFAKRREAKRFQSWEPEGFGVV